MEKHGLEYFRSFTTDNGSEFFTLSFMEEDVTHLQLLFTHAYAAWEKGINGRHNGILREFIPKGQSLRSLKYTDLQRYTDAINTRPRKILDDKSPIEIFGGWDKTEIKTEFTYD